MPVLADEDVRQYLQLVWHEGSDWPMLTGGHWSKVAHHGPELAELLVRGGLGTWLGPEEVCWDCERGTKD